MKRVGLDLGRLREAWGRSVPGQAAAMLPERPRRKLVLLVLVQLALGGLDLLAVGLGGVVGTLAVAGVQSQRIGPDGTIGRVLSLLGLDGFGATQQVAILAVLTALLFLARTAASITLTRRALHFLGIRAAEASAGLIQRLLRQPLTYLQTRSMQDFIYSVTSSANALILGVLGTLVIMAADAAILVGLGILMFYVSPLVALAAAALLGTVVLLLHRLTTGRAHSLGEESARFDVASRNLLVEAISTFRDMRVRGSEGYYERETRDVRLRAAWVAAEWTFLPNVSKYVLESSVVVGALVVGALEFALEDAQRAVGVLTLFLAAGTRLAPAVIRLQQGATTLKMSVGQGKYALAMWQELRVSDAHPQPETTFVTHHEGFSASVSLSNVNYTYPAATVETISDISLQIEPGQMVALVGPSGAGKSTIADLLLGALTPQSGEVVLSGVAPAEAVRRWPGALGYVPQDVWIADGTIRSNINLGFDAVTVPDQAIWDALKAAHLDDFVRNLSDGLDAQVGERGAKLSGGQRQRLGIARALLTRPQILVLDEATSALDAVTEHEVTEALRGLQGSTTVIVVAHRLATVRHADVVVYLEAGRAVAQGSFDTVRSQVPGFDRQAALLGL